MKNNVKIILDRNENHFMINKKMLSTKSKLDDLNFALNLRKGQI